MTAKVELLTPSGGKVILDPTDTAVDRTLTLPAVAGTVFNQGNVVGTVSESSGVPTGAIIESGSNANGEFVKFADGTMICSVTRGDAIGPSTGDDQGTYYAFLSVPYPATFISGPATSGSKQEGANGFVISATSKNNSEWQIKQTLTGSWGTGAGGFHAIAVGRWF